MHEAHLVHDLMRRIDAVAQQNGAARVAGVRVWLGALSHFSPAHFAEHFRDASSGTLAEGARVACEISDDPRHPDAQGVRLLSIEVD